MPAAKVASKVTGAGKHPTGKPLRETYEQRWNKYGVKWQKELPRLVWHDVYCILRIISHVVSNPLVLVVVIMLALFCGQSSGVVIRLSRCRKHLCELHGWPTRRDLVWGARSVPICARQQRTARLDMVANPAWQHSAPSLAASRSGPQQRCRLAPSGFMPHRGCTGER